MIALLYVSASLISLLLLVLLLYVLLFIRPHKGAHPDQALLCDYAHRGLHGESVPENSLMAFERAIERGTGIELDVQLSLDGEVMVFHDDTLTRMTGVEEKLSALPCEDLTQLTLGDSDQTIPRFCDVLTLVGGRVPLLIELKGETTDTSLCQKLAEILRNYQGAYCIESFNPLLIKAMRRELPNAFYGQLYTNVCRDKKKRSVLNLLLSAMAFNFLSHPDFIAYNKKDRHSLPVRLSTSLYRVPRFVWTVKGEDEMKKAHERGEHPIFEET